MGKIGFIVGLHLLVDFDTGMLLVVASSGRVLASWLVTFKSEQRSRFESRYERSMGFKLELVFKRTRVHS